MQKIILHIITGLNTGGAETMLYKLLTKADRTAFYPEVISLTSVGPIGEKIKALGIEVQALGMSRGVPDPRSIFRLGRLLRQKRPHLIQTWMYHADLIGGLAAKLAGGVPVIWGIRHSNLDPEGNKRTTIWTAKACARFSNRLPNKIICCSEASKRVHAKLGYNSQKMIVIPNGFELSSFVPDPEAKLSVRKELNIPDDALIIGLVARYDPQKDHQNFIQAVSILKDHIFRTQYKIHFMLCGEGVTWENRKIAEPIEKTGLRQQFHLLGRRDDMPRLTAAMDIASSSSSYGEGFPNVVGEAMSCEVPCVVTDVGDSALIVGDTGYVVPPRDSKALAQTWIKLIEMGHEGRKKLGMAARERIMENFNLENIVDRYETLYKEIVQYNNSVQ